MADKGKPQHQKKKLPKSMKLNKKGKPVPKNSREYPGY